MKLTTIAYLLTDCVAGVAEWRKCKIQEIKYVTLIQLYVCFSVFFFFLIKRKAVFLWGHFCLTLLHGMGTPFLGNILSYLYLVLRGEAKSLFNLCLAS